ncbi:UbiA family prenyltransferase [Herminiimonas sp.]|uniref:UbiA family prenyltransferase n=1 Tax=Herminiimonas sp. TaxID=1926289 RepID=UPI0027223F7D|nr:UbiA family prenyltransferase [Herminiimonas sp.]MDO8306350.1 UbiA family prenyltransferase [Herminiimonas sp.]
MSVSPGSLPHPSLASPDSVRDAANPSVAMLPLYVDLDGTLTYTDLLFESVLLLIKRNPLYLFLCCIWLLRGRGNLKAQIASRIELDVSLLPYNNELLAYLQHQHVAGRRLILASASDRTLVQRVADYLGIFDAVLASDAATNLKSKIKLQAIVADSGENGFAYAGNAAPDLAVWAHAAELIVVNASPAIVAQVQNLKTPALIIPPRPFQWRLLIKALRLHQWAKNALLFVPLMAAHDLNADRWLATLLAFLAFGMCASATYIINDLFDLASDRAHPRKQARPFAAATLTIPFGVVLLAVLLPLSLWLAAAISLPFFGLMLLYVVVTLLYSARLKQIAIIDVLVLASLYTHRILAGGQVSDVVISNWLLAVSLFMFLSLALVKRCAELEFMSGDGHVSLAGRGYRTSDLSYLIAMGIASGFVAVMLLALYVDSQVGGAMYPHAEILWLILPLMLFWVMRLWLKVSRLEIQDDPLLFAITDRSSWVVAILVACVALAASVGGMS